MDEKKFRYQFRVKKFRNGSVEYKYMCPLLRGEFRPTVWVASPEETAADAQGGAIYATGISGYTRRFRFLDLDAAMAYVADVPLKVGGFVRD